MFPWCLVAFQKIFRKIFSGVWKRRRKTQIQKNTSHNPKKNHQRRAIKTQQNASNQAKETKTQQKKMNQRRATSGAIAVRRATSGAMSDERRAVRSSIDERACQTRTAHRSRCSSIDKRCDRPTSGVIDDRCSPILALSSLTLSLIWALSSLSLSFSENELKWKWWWKIISGSNVKISVNRKLFSRKWNLLSLPNAWVWGKMIS